MKHINKYPFTAITATQKFESFCFLRVCLALINKINIYLFAQRERERGWWGEKEREKRISFDCLSCNKISIN